MPSLSTDVDNSEDASFSTDGTYWRARAGLEWGKPAWGVALVGEMDRSTIEGAGPVESPSGDVRLGKGEFDKKSLSLLLRFGAGLP